MPDLAVTLYVLMVVPMVLLVGVHLFCRRITFLHPAIMPDTSQRRMYRHAEAAMATACASMVWYGWALLPDMIAICAVDPWLGYKSHGPWILATWGVLVAKTGHMWRLIGQVKELA